MVRVSYHALCAAVKGDVDKGTVYCGQGAGMLGELKHAGDVIREIMEGAREVVNERRGIAGH